MSVLEMSEKTKGMNAEKNVHQMFNAQIYTQFIRHK